MSSPGSNTDRFEDRLKKIEERLDDDDRSFIKKYGAWGGLIALTISILTGGLGLFDRAKLYAEYDSRKLSELSGIAREMRQIMRESETIRAAGDKRVYEAFFSSIRVDIANLLNKAETVGAGIASQVSFGDAITFSEFHGLNGDFIEAERFARLAVEAAPSLQFKVIAHNQLIRSYYYSSTDKDLKFARLVFTDALKLTDSLPPNLQDQVLFQLHATATYMEAVQGNCEYAFEVFSEIPRRLNNYVEQHANALGRDIEIATSCKLRRKVR